jgi:hypothetical protein
MAVAKKLKARSPLRLRRTQSKARIRHANAAPDRPPGYFKDALTQEDIDQDNQVANAVARMNTRHSKTALSS